MTFDTQHANAERIYRVIEYKKTKTENLSVAAASYQLAEEARRSIGEIENTARIIRTGRDNLWNPERPEYKVNENIVFANNGLMEIFDFQALEGDPKTALLEPNTIVVTEALAQRYFKSSNVLGKTLQFGFQEAPLRITAVLKNHPRNSSFDFTILISEATYATDEDFRQRAATDWSSNAFMVFAQLRQNTDPRLVAPKLTQLVHNNFKQPEGSSVAYGLQALKDMHLYSEGITDRSRNANVEAMQTGSLFYLKIFGAVGLFVLLLACINYMNLTTAKASSRSREIGVRKANGAFRDHLVRQFMLESLVVTGFSFVLAIFLVNLLLPAFNAFTEKELSLGFSTDRRIWALVLASVGATGVLAGSYPALVLSRFSPMVLLKNMKLKNTGDLSLRKTLVVFQFSVSVIMILSTIVLYRQVEYLNNKNLGFNKELLVVVDINSGKVRKGAETVQAGFAKIPGVKDVSVTSRVPGEWKTIPTVKVRQEGDTEEHRVAYFLCVDEDFSKTFGIELLKGKNFSDVADTSAVLLNETAAKMLGIEAIAGQTIEIPERAFNGIYRPLDDGGKTFRARVAGVVKDFHFQSLREKIAPLVMGYQYNPVHTIDYFTSRIEGQDIPGTLQKMEAVLASIDPDHGLEYHFLDEQLARFYIEDARRQTMLIWAALAAIFIACMGLFGLATYAAEQRIKEIGIRKVLGASVAGITTLLAKDFLKLVFVAIVVATPAAYLFMKNWLSDFAYRIEMQWWMFAAAGAVAVAVAVLTVGFQSVKAALANPVKSLRSE
jgi:putative ABC transport system permease protein